MAKVKKSQFVLELDMEDLLEYLIREVETDDAYFRDKLESIYGITVPVFDLEQIDLCIINNNLIHITINRGED